MVIEREGGLLRTPADVPHGKHPGRTRAELIIDLDPVALEDLGDRRGDVGVLARHRTRVDDDDLRTDPQALCELGTTHGWHHLDLPLAEESRAAIHGGDGVAALGRGVDEFLRRDAADVDAGAAAHRR